VGFGPRAAGLRKGAPAFSGVRDSSLHQTGNRAIRTAIYIDGFNLYYWLKPTPYRWVDLRQLAVQAIAHPVIQHDVVTLKYFTARVSATVRDPGKAVRQDVYLRALRAMAPEFTPFFGEFRRQKKRMPCVTPGNGVGPLVDVWATEEKGSDVNLAVELVNDAWRNIYDMAIVISNDSDLHRALATVKARGKRVGVLVRGDARVVSLRKVSHFQRTLAVSDAARALLPARIPGTSIHIPAEWLRKERDVGLRR
jgi:hypothetical protein